MRLILKFVLAISILAPSLPSAVHAQYLSDTERRLIWERERNNAIRQNRADEYRLERERARNYYDGGSYNRSYNSRRYYGNRNRNGFAKGAGFGLGYRLGEELGEMILNTPQRAQPIYSGDSEGKAPPTRWCSARVTTSCRER